MQIKKINNNKLKIILNLNDLNEKNIDINSFLANPIDSQNLFFEILDLAEKKYNFDIEDNKAIIESISLDNNIFIITITKISTDNYSYNSKSKTYYFENTNDLLILYSFMKKNNIRTTEIKLYKFLNKYYLVLYKENTKLENALLEFSNFINTPYYLQDILIEYGKKI